MTDTPWHPAAAADTVEATAILMRREDGWHFAIVFPSPGGRIESEEAYPTQEAAQAALDLFCEQTGAIQMKVQ
jgi:hypothetical protein